MNISDLKPVFFRDFVGTFSYESEKHYVVTRPLVFAYQDCLLQPILCFGINHPNAVLWAMNRKPVEHCPQCWERVGDLLDVCITNQYRLGCTCFVNTTFVGGELLFESNL